MVAFYFSPQAVPSPFGHFLRSRTWGYEQTMVVNN
jgi:hypothetical protein